MFVGAKWSTCEGTGKEEITDYLQTGEKGTRVEIAIATDKGRHLFVGENIDGKAVFSDPQNGKTNAVTYFDMNLTDSVEYCRIDNLRPSNLISECIERKEKK